jgi:hypothetical protein
MVLGFRVTTVCLVVSLTVVGPFAPLSFAQQPATQPPAAQPTAPAPPAQPSARPDVSQEVVKGQPAEYQSQMGPEEAAAGNELPRPVYQVFAGVTTAFFSIPGRTVTCVVGSAVAFGLLGLTLGSGYRAAAGILNEGCGGKWIVRADDLRPRPPLPERISPEPR